MKEVARFPSFTEAWQQLADEYHYFPKYRRFMDAVIGDVAKEHPAPTATKHRDEAPATPHPDHK
jgi:hypothetical protein